MSRRVSTSEAREIAQRFIDGHFRNEGKERPRISIPADEGRDDDLRLVAFIERAERVEIAARRLADRFSGFDHGIAEVDSLRALLDLDGAA